MRTSQRSVILPGFIGFARLSVRRAVNPDVKPGIRASDTAQYVILDITSLVTRLPLFTKERVILDVNI